VTLVIETQHGPGDIEGMNAEKVKTPKEEKPVLTNPDEFPDATVLRKHLGPCKTAWNQFTHMIKEEHPAFELDWRYYKDGNSWLCKVTLKTKTICWVSIWPKLFKTTFYFGGKAEPIIVNSELDPVFVDQYLYGQRYGKIRAITVETTQASDLIAIRQLIAIKEKVK